MSWAEAREALDRFFDDQAEEEEEDRRGGSCAECACSNNHWLAAIASDHFRKRVIFAPVRDL
jgi:hypothetical protein